MTGNEGSISFQVVQTRELNKSLNTCLLCTKKSYYLRYPLWRDKAGGLDHRQACSWEHVYQLDFHPCRNNFLGNNETETALSGFDSSQDGRHNKYISGCKHIVTYIHMLNLAPARHFEIFQNIKCLLLLHTAVNKIISASSAICKTKEK